MITRRSRSLWIVAALCVAVLLFTGLAAAQDEPDTLPPTGAASNTANAYVSQLDELRAMGQAAARTRAEAAASRAAYEYTDDLQRLNDMAARGRQTPTANDYITSLDYLRDMARQVNE